MAEQNPLPPSLQSAIERWLEDAVAETDLDVQPRRTAGLSIAGQWQRMQRLLETHLRRQGAPDDVSEGASGLAPVTLDASQRVVPGALAGVSEYRLAPLGGLREGFDVLTV